MAWTAFFIIVGVLLIASSLLALIIALSARKIDFGDRLFSRPIIQRLKRIRENFLLNAETRDSAEDESIKSRHSEPIISAETLVDSESARIEEELEMPSKIVDTEKEKSVKGIFARDLAIRIPKNMCLEEVFRLKVILSKTEKFSEELEIKEIELDKKEAKFFALNTEKLGTKIEEATTTIEGLEEGPLTIRPISIGNVASIAPSSRTIFFDPEKEIITAEFFITPIKWSKELVSTLRIEFEQKHILLKVVNLPIRIYKHKFEALFGLNISKFQQTVLIVYSLIGTLLGLLSTFQNKIVPLMQKFFG